MCATLAKQPGGACDAALREAASVLAKSKDTGAIVQRCHAGLTIVAAPVRGDGGVIGVVYATGARAGVDASELVQRLGVLGAEAPAMAAVAPELTEGDLSRVRDLVASAAAAVERVQPA